MMFRIKSQYHKGLLMGFMLSFLFCISVGATSSINWQKSEVTPICVVKPSMFGQYVPTDGSSLFINWQKNQVTPVCKVKPGVGGFVPVNGSSIGNTWSKSKVVPMCPVKSSIGGFSPLYD